jgi:hypothetical protein
MRHRDSRRFDRLRLKNVRCFRDAEVPLDPHVTVVMGENGSGKTTLIEALASLTDGKDEGLSAFPLRKGARGGEIAVYNTGGRRPAARWVQGKETTPGRRLPEDRYLFAYGRYRRVFAPKEAAAPGWAEWRTSDLLSQMMERAGRDRTCTLDRPDNNLLRDLSRYLGALDEGRKFDPHYEKLWQRLNASLPKLDNTLTEIRMVERESVTVPMLVRNGVELELRELSDGYQALLVVIFDLMFRYRSLFLDLPDPSQGEAVVGVDEVDLHLHPRWQRNVVAQLMDLFPNTQFVLTTHSPIVVQGAIDCDMTVLTLREKEGAVAPRPLGRRLAAALRGAEVGSLLLEKHLFGVESRYSTRYSELERRIDELQAQISRGIATDKDQRELSRNLRRLEELVANEDLRRADGSTVAQMVKLQAAFVKDLLAELKKTRS